MSHHDKEERKGLLEDTHGRSIDPVFQYGTTDPAVAAFQREHRSRRGHARAATLGAFRVVEPPLAVDPARLPKSYSVSGDGRLSYLTAVELGRQELYTQVPFAAVFGLQAKERELRRAFASYAANVNVQSHPEWDEQEKRQRSTQASAMILDELDEADSPRRLTNSFIWAVVVATASQFSVGYNTGVMNAPEKVVFPGHSTALWSFAVAAFAVGGPFGAIVGGSLADSRGRRGALLLDIWAFMLGGVLQTMATDMRVIILSRFIIGFASGFSSVLVPIYLGELAPPRLRGALGTLTQFAMVIGIFMADLLAFPFATESSWRYLFAVTPIVALIQILASPYLLESPRWLLNHDPKSLLARSIIRQLRGLRDEIEMELEIGNYILGEAAQHQDEQKSQYEIIREMITHKKIRVLLFSSLLLQMSQQFSGINAVFYYSTSFFEGVIENPLVGTTVVGGVNVVATYIALLLMDSSGRRTLILWSSGGMFLSCVVIVLSLLGYFSNILALVAVNAYVTFFDIGLGPIPWLIVAEMFEGKYVATAMSLCSQLNWACNFVVGLVFPFMNEYLGPLSFGPFALVLAFCFLYAWFVLPETQGTTPEKLIADITSRNSRSLIFDSNVDPETLTDRQWGHAVHELQVEEEKQMKEGGYDYGFHSITAETGNLLSITAVKGSQDERLGISLLVKSGRLYVHSISSTSPFAKTNLQVNDLVEGINGIDFVDNPDLQHALSLVQSAPKTIHMVPRSSTCIWGAGVEEPDSTDGNSDDETSKMPSTPFDRPVLSLIDAVMLVVFAAVGKASHNTLDGTLDLGAVAQTAGPFLVSWFAVSPWLGCFTPMATGDWKESTVTTTKAWIVAIPLGCVLRGILKGYIPPLPFVMVTMIATWVLLVGGRSVYTIVSEVFVETF